MPIRAMPADPSLVEGVSCDESGCVTQAADGRFVALALRPRGAGGRLRPRRLDRDRTAGAAGLRGLGDHERAPAPARRDGAAAQPGRICRSMRSSPQASTGRGRRRSRAMARARGQLRRRLRRHRAIRTRRRRNRTCTARIDGNSRVAGAGIGRQFEGAKAIFFWRSSLQRATLGAVLLRAS